jgi:two-component system, NtrC family, sensor kinase
MRKKIRFPLRLKILTTVLIVITAVVSVITFTMANLFHADKSAYIHDLTSATALNATQEINMLLEGYRERLQVYTHLLGDNTLTGPNKNDLIKKLLEDSGEFVAITIYRNGVDQGSVYDVKLLKDAGLSKEDLQLYRERNPLHLQQIVPRKVFVTNSTISEKLPTLTMAILQNPNTDNRIVAVAVIKLDRILDLARQSKVFETYVLDSQGILLAQRNIKEVVRHEKISWIPHLNELLGGNVMIRTLEFSRNNIELVGGFGIVKEGGLLVGVDIPKSAAYLTARGLLKNLFGVSLGLLVGAALLSLFWSYRITRPMVLLSKASRQVGQGDFNVQVTPSSNDEIGELAGSFNQMTNELHFREIALHKAQEQLVQSEKMAAFGQLGAGIAHEVRNPLAGILGYTQLSLRKVERETKIHKNLMIIEKETKRCTEIINSLLKFARQEKFSLELIDINQVIEDAAAIVDHQLSINDIRLEKELVPGLPQIMGNANQIQQVLINLMINSQQAMDGNPGFVRLSSQYLDPGHIELRVSDNGPGMNEEVKARLFEPFFTTKSGGQGTGLGLSVSFGIIKQHKGEIQIESEPGSGAAFIITLPAAKMADTTNSTFGHVAE